MLDLLCYLKLVSYYWYWSIVWRSTSDWSVVVIMPSYWSPVGDITLRYTRDLQLCQKGQCINNSYFLAAGAVRFVWTEIHSSVRSGMQSKQAEHTRYGNVPERAQSKTVHLVNNFLFIHIWNNSSQEQGFLCGVRRDSHTNINFVGKNF